MKQSMRRIGLVAGREFMAAVVTNAAGGLRTPITGPGTGFHRKRGGLGLLVSVNQAQGLFKGITHLNTPHQDALKGIGAGGAQAGLFGHGLGGRGQFVKIQGIPGQGAHVA